MVLIFGYKNASLCVAVRYATPFIVFISVNFFFYFSREASISPVFFLVRKIVENVKKGIFFSIVKMQCNRTEKFNLSVCTVFMVALQKYVLHEDDTSCKLSSEKHVNQTNAQWTYAPWQTKASVHVKWLEIILQKWTHFLIILLHEKKIQHNYKHKHKVYIKTYTYTNLHITNSSYGSLWKNNVGWKDAITGRRVGCVWCTHLFSSNIGSRQYTRLLGKQNNK